MCDDFKVYFNTKVPELMGLKISQHTRKNRRGPVLHEMVRSATGLIIALYFEIKYDSPVMSTFNMIKNTLLKMQGGSLLNVRSDNLSRINRSVVYYLNK